MNNYSFNPHHCRFAVFNISFIDTSPDAIAIMQIKKAVMMSRQIQGPLKLKSTKAEQRDNPVKTKYFESNALLKSIFKSLIQK